MLPFAYRRCLYGVKEGGIFFTSELEMAQCFFLGQMTRNQTDDGRREGRRSSGDRKETETSERAEEMTVVLLVQKIHLVELALHVEVAVTKATLAFNGSSCLHRQKSVD